MIEFGGADGFPLIVDLDGQRFSAFRLEFAADHTVLQFTEFQVWSADDDGRLVNVAFEQKATQSSIGVPGRGPKKGVNNRIIPEAAVLTQREDHPWWQVDLAQPYDVSHIVLYGQLRRAQMRADTLRIAGHRDGEWHVVFDQTRSDDATAALTNALRSVAARLNAVLDRSLVPHITIDEQTGAAVLDPTQIGPAWYQRRRLEQLLEVVDVLIGLVEGTEEAPRATLDALRLAADALIPTTKPDEGPFSWFADLSAFDSLEPRSDAVGYLNLSIRSVPAQGFMFDATRRSSPGSDTCSQASLGQTSSLHAGDPISVSEGFCELAIATTNSPDTWELWGVASGTPPRLIYDSELTGTALVVIYRVLRNLGLRTWPVLHGLLRTLELSSHYTIARAFAQHLAVEDPGDAVFDMSINEIEVRSFLDPARDPVSRTKHGYRTPFRFRNHEKYATGVHFLIDLLRQDERFAQVFPAYGTLLGFVREGSFIAHDDDADLIVVIDAEGKEAMTEVFDQLRKYLSGRGMTLYPGGKRLPGHNLPVAFNADGEWVHIDIFFSYLVDGQRVLFDVKTNTFEPADDDLLELGRFVDVQGQRFEIPQRSEDLLEFWYGPDWETPYNPPVDVYSWQIHKG